MYDNVGMKIKVLAGILCGLFMFLFVMIGVSQLSSNFALGVLIVALGGFCSWAAFISLYGFGELIEETKANRENTDRILAILESQQCNDHVTNPVADDSTGM